MQVRILQPAKTPMQSGASLKKWVIEFANQERAIYREEVMGWYGTNSTLAEVRLEFDLLADAIAFAEAKGYEYEVIQPQKKKLVKKNYTNNFLKN